MSTQFDPRETVCSNEYRQTAQDLAKSFAVQHGEYYCAQFDKLGESREFVWTFNWAAVLFGPIWFGARGLWGLFWPFVLAEIVALVQLGRGLWGQMGAENIERARHLMERAAVRANEAQEALDAGKSNAKALFETAGFLEQGALAAQEAAASAAAQGPKLLIIGLVLLILVKVSEGVLANWALEKRFMLWRSDRSIRSGLHKEGALGALVLMTLLYPLTLYHYTATKPIEWLASFPAERSWHKNLSSWLDQGFDWVTLRGEGMFDSIRIAIQVLLSGLEAIFISTPWPVIMIVVVVLAWRLAGMRVAIYTVVGLAYLALLGFWEKSMATVALLGTAAFISIVIGIPLGVWCAKKPKVYAMVRPILDFMQTMPAFVYLIPVIAFFGTGKPPSILATVIFGMPPVVRLTALGLQGVPESVREAATAFGASRTYLLFKVDLPLALPSIMAGINQTILMCLSMVVIASLIGAKGLGEDVLEALQYAAEGQGMLAGMAILICAMILDRIVQGKNTSQKMN